MLFLLLNHCLFLAANALIYKDALGMGSKLYGYWPFDNSNNVAKVAFENLQSRYAVVENADRLRIRTLATDLNLFEAPNPFGYINASLAIATPLVKYDSRSTVYMTDCETRLKSNPNMVDNGHVWGETGVTVAGYFYFGRTMTGDNETASPFRIGRELQTDGQQDLGNLYLGVKVHEPTTKVMPEINLRYGKDSSSIQANITIRKWTFFAYTYSAKTDTEQLFVSNSVLSLFSRQLLPSFNKAKWLGGIGLGSASRYFDAAGSFIVYHESLSQLQIAQLPCLLRNRGNCPANVLKSTFQRPVYSPKGLLASYSLNFDSPLVEMVEGLQPAVLQASPMGSGNPPFFDRFGPAVDGQFSVIFEHPKNWFLTAEKSFTLTFYLRCIANENSPESSDTLLTWGDLSISIDPQVCSPLFLNFGSSVKMKIPLEIYNHSASEQLWHYFALKYDHLPKIILVLTPQNAMAVKGDFSGQRSNQVKIGPTRSQSQISLSCLAIFNRALADQEILFDHQCNCPDSMTVLTPQFLFDSSNGDICRDKIDTNPMLSPSWLSQVSRDVDVAYFPLSFNTELLNIARRYSFFEATEKPKIMSPNIVPVFDGPFQGANSFTFIRENGPEVVEPKNHFIEFPSHLRGLRRLFGATFSFYYFYINATKNVNRRLMNVQHANVSSDVDDSGLAVWALEGGILAIRHRKVFVKFEEYKLAPNRWNFVAISLNASLVVKWRENGTVASLIHWRIVEDFWIPKKRRWIFLGPWAEHEKLACVMFKDKILNKTEISALPCICQTQGRCGQEIPLTPIEEPTTTVETTVTDAAIRTSILSTSKTTSKGSHAPHETKTDASSTLTTAGLKNDDESTTKMAKTTTIDAALEIYPISVASSSSVNLMALILITLPLI